VSALAIRDARPADSPAIESLTLAAYGQYAAQLPPPYWDAYRNNILATLADVTPAAQLVAERAGRILGAVLLYPAGAAFPRRDDAAGIVKWPEVRLLAVEPAARGQGVGNALMQACIQRARAAEAEALTLHTTPMMAAAMRLYARLGFVHVPELDFEPAPGLTVRGFRLTLEA
jgi:GNAT superfamily N-acetyltransferase